MWALARRPRWIAALALCLAFAAGFALLSQWQLSRSVSRAVVEHRSTETAVPLDTIAEPQKAMTTAASGQLVTVSGNYVGADFTVLSGRENFGETGYWLVGHLIDYSKGANGPSVVVALGWAKSRAAASAIIPQLESISAEQHLTGRLLPSEQPEEDNFEQGERKSMAVSAIINDWAEAPSSVYSGFVIAQDAPAGLRTIDSPPPVPDITLNWLNIFYAIEWVLFAGFAIYLWFRLLRDAWEREQEETAELN
jgi:surfeit locus 1 family protein